MKQQTQRPAELSLGRAIYKHVMRACLHSEHAISSCKEGQEFRGPLGGGAALSRVPGKGNGSSRCLTVSLGGDKEVGLLKCSKTLG